MKAFVSILVQFLILCACGSPSQTKNPTGTTADSNTRSDSITNEKSQHCYIHIHGRDSVHMIVNAVSDSVQGSLHFNNYQIDDSRGSIRGRFHGDTLFVVYDFMAEGMRSRTAEAFLKRGDSLIRSLGEEHLTKDFSKGQVFLNVPCL